MQSGDIVGATLEAAVGVRRMLQACFIAGTPLLTPEGSKRIEEFAVGDWVLSRNELEEGSPVRPQRVLQVFVRLGRVLELSVGGQVLGTTAEHPFWVDGQGWVAAGELLKVEGLRDTDEVQTVYNLEVDEDHTYFVGCAEWGFSVWAHNEGYAIVNPQNGHSYPAGASDFRTRQQYRKSVGQAKIEDTSTNSRYFRKHHGPKGDDAVAAQQRSGNGGDAQFHPSISREHAGALQRLALQKGYLVNHGDGSVHAYLQLDKAIGYNNRKATTWIRAELTNNGTSIHGHPFNSERVPIEAHQFFQQTSGC